MRNEAAADELVVEAFWRAYRAHARFQASGSFGAWLRRIATNAALDHLKRKRPETALLEDLPGPSQPDGAVQRETAAQIRHAIAALPPKLRIVVLLSLVHEEPMERIANALGISHTAARVRLFRSVSILRSKLQTTGVHS